MQIFKSKGVGAADTCVGIWIAWIRLILLGIKNAPWLSTFALNCTPLNTVKRIFRKRKKNEKDYKRLKFSNCKISKYMGEQWVRNYFRPVFRSKSMWNVSPFGISTEVWKWPAISSCFDSRPLQVITNRRNSCPPLINHSWLSSWFENKAVPHLHINTK